MTLIDVLHENVYEATHPKIQNLPRREGKESFHVTYSRLKHMALNNVWDYETVTGINSKLYSYGKFIRKLRPKPYPQNFYETRRAVVSEN
jgi:hypothetical protein